MNSQQRLDHLDFLDFLRGLAAFLVYLFHARVASCNIFCDTTSSSFVHLNPKILGESLITLFCFMSANGGIGVAMFFALSGFCIHLAYLRKPDWKEFFVRRFFRIYPLYIFTVFVFAGLFPLTRTSDSGQIFSHVLLVHNLNSLYSSGINAAYWSIGVEFQLYLVYPLLVLLVFKFGWKASLSALLLIELCLRALFYTHLRGAFVAYSPFTFWFSWAIGAYAADCLYHGRKNELIRLSPPWLFVAAACISLLPVFENLKFTLFSLATCAWISRRISALPAKRSLVIDYFKDVGKVSYSVYLLHYPLLSWLSGLYIHKGENTFWHCQFVFVLFLLFWFVTMLLSKLTYALIEVPGQELGKRLAIWRGKACDQKILQKKTLKYEAQ